MAEYNGQRVGQQLGNYQLTRLLGAGGFAEVYLGEHIHLGTYAAIKVLHTRLTEDEVDKFRTEARTIARLSHPNIVRVLDFGVEGTTPFLVMEYAPNGTLRQYYLKGMPLSISNILPNARQVAEALQYAHEEKVIHRDIKPENMFVGKRNEVLLGDFGIALVAQSSRYQGTQDMAGTMAYMAPEQIQGKPRPASDQYSLAIVIYEWLSGDRPFHGSLTEVVGQHLSVLPPPLREKNPTVLPDVERVVMTALAKDPKERFGSVKAFVNALEQASQHVQPPTLVTNPPLTQPLPEPEGITDLSLPATRPLRYIEPTVVSLLSIYRKHSGKVNTLAWSPDSARIASGSDDKTVQVWDAASSSTVFSSGDLYGVNAVSWSPDGKLVAYGAGDATVHIWDMAAQAKIYTYQGHSYPVIALAWSPAGVFIASGCHDKTVQVWSTTTATRVLRGHAGGVRSVAWSQDGSRLASAGRDAIVQVWNVATGEILFTYRGHADWVDSVAWSPDGVHVASGAWDNTAKVWSTTLEGKIITYYGHTSFVFAVAWSPDGSRIASASKDGTVQVWEAATGHHIYTYRGHSGDVKIVAWSPDGRYIASAGDDRTVQVWGTP